MIVKSQTTSSLITKAYEIDDENYYWNIIDELHKRGSDIEFNAAKKLTLSEDVIEREIGADVITSAAFSLGHRNDFTAIPYLERLIEHPTPRARLGLVSGLSCLDDKNAVNALIKLSYDLDYDVINWATFGLGSLCGINSKNLRGCLAQTTTGCRI